MGYPMASNLLKKMNPAEFYVNDYLQDVAISFQKEHPTAHVAASPAEIAEKCSIIITMLPASQQVRSVYLGEKGLLRGLQAKSMVIDSSTIDPSTVKELSKVLRSKTVSFLDAPVSGGEWLKIILAISKQQKCRNSWRKRCIANIHGGS